MSFPASYNISYYHGDTLELDFSPKNADGTAFALSGFGAQMDIAEARGLGASVSLSTTNGEISIANDTISVVMPAAYSTQLDAAKGYVYDLQISDGTLVYTIVTGNITITEDVTQ